MARILGLDYGRKKTGVAVTDPLQLIVSPLRTIPTSELMGFIEEYKKTEAVEKIVLGEPFMADGVTPAQHHSNVMNFKKKLEQKWPDIPVILYDETFSSRRAREIVIKSVASKKKRRDKTLVDKVAATLILQEYLKHIQKMILPIYAYGQPVLKKVAKTVDADFPGLEKLIDDMWETMYNASGVGLAAPQVGQSIRMFIVDTIQLREDEDKINGIKKVFINPEKIEEYGEDFSYEEGCLSIPDIRADVTRERKLKIKFYNENFEEQIEEFDGVNARVIQHEYDHIEGVLFIEKINPLKRNILRRKLDKIRKGKISPDYKMSFKK